jgi:hypothetical protein
LKDLPIYLKRLVHPLRAVPPKVRFASDSPLEQRRFELMVPPRTPAFRGRHTTLAFDRLSWAWPADGDRRRSDRTVEVDACFREGAFD